MQRIAVIMAGGSGERFWPLSRHNRPKQLLNLTQPNQTMLGEAIHRLQPLIPPENIYVITGNHLLQPIRDAGVGLPPENILAEPCKRNTSGCLAYAAAHLIATRGAPETLSVAVVTADHLIRDEALFRDTVATALDTVEHEPVLATHGIVPTRPETGYGYIEMKNPTTPTQPDRPIPVYDVAAFHEKPDRETAQKFLDSGKYLWNSGMFFWRLDTFLTELDHAQPTLAQATRHMARSLAEHDTHATKKTFETIENLSIDYALMERAKRVVVVQARYPWDDVGALTSLERTRQPDPNGNIAEGDPVLIDTHNSIVVNEAGPENIAVSVVGMHNVAVIVTRDGVLVIPKDRAQDVRHAVAELKKRGADQV